MLDKTFRVQKLFTKHMDKDILIFTIEELSELIHSLCKYKKLLKELEECYKKEEKDRYKSIVFYNSYKLVDDMADVEICLKQLEYWLSTTQKVKDLNLMLRSIEEEKIQSFALRNFGANKAQRIIRIHKKEFNRLKE